MGVGGLGGCLPSEERPATRRMQAESSRVALSHRRQRASAHAASAPALLLPPSDGAAPASTSRTSLPRPLQQQQHHWRRQAVWCSFQQKLKSRRPTMAAANTPAVPHEMARAAAGCHAATRRCEFNAGGSAGGAPAAAAGAEVGTGGGGSARAAAAAAGNHWPFLRPSAAPRFPFVERLTYAHAAARRRMRSWHGAGEPPT